MGYCAKADLVERFGDQELKELTDEVSATTDSDAEIAAACDEASSLIDSYLGARYTVPLASPPAIVKQWACFLARLALWGDRAGKDSAVRADADRAVAVIKDLAKGIGQLPGQGTAAAPQIAFAMTERTQKFPDSLFVDPFPTA